MRHFLLLMVLTFAFSACGPGTEKDQNEGKTSALSVKVYDHFSDINHLFHTENDTTYVINYWATSCKPCIKEMPHFEHLNKVYSDKKLKVILISLDLKRHLEKRVIPFVKKLDLKSEVILLADQNYSEWTASMASEWYGALPFTIIRKNNKKSFHFGAFATFEDLDTVVKAIMEN